MKKEIKKPSEEIINRYLTNGKYDPRKSHKIAIDNKLNSKSISSKPMDFTEIINLLFKS